MTTTPPLAVPPAAVAALTDHFGDGRHRDDPTFEEMARAIAAPVVAAELRRVATQSFYDFRDSGDAALVRDALRRRADEIEHGQGGKRPMSTETDGCGEEYDHDLRLIAEDPDGRTYECRTCGAEVFDGDDAGEVGA